MQRNGAGLTFRSRSSGESRVNAAYLSALAALAGSVVGGLMSGLTTWLNQRDQARAAQRAQDLSRREDLFRDFIVAASKAYGAALVSSEPKIEELVALYSMISRMRVSCLPRTIMCAENIMGVTVDTYFAPNKTIRDLHDLVKSGAGIDPLKDFAEAAREELQTSLASL
jgi:hypothetical protein